MKTINDYQHWRATAMARPDANGFEVDPRDLHSSMRDDQRAISQWAIGRGRAALFVNTGGGKTFNGLEWSRVIAERTGRKIIGFAPLVVADQTVEEATQRWGIPARYVANQEEADAASEPILISNYERIENFNYREFAGAWFDESSILKNARGKTRHLINRLFAHMPYRLASTATPSPNEHDELGNHSQALGIMPWHEMITRWFIRDSNQADTLRLKKHAEAGFWEWVSEWAVCMMRPSDLGFSDAGFDLPPLNIEHITVDIDPGHAWAQGTLIPMQSLSATDLHRNKKLTLIERMEAAAAFVERDRNAPCVAWVERDDEADLLMQMLPSATEVRGSETFDVKRAKLRDFTHGNIRVLVTKPSICGFGVNWQHCYRSCVASMTYSFEQLYQLIRRFHRFGQTRPVEIGLISAATEGNVVLAIERKERQFLEMQAKMNDAMRKAGLLAKRNVFDDYDYRPSMPMQLPAWMTNTTREVSHA